LQGHGPSSQVGDRSRHHTQDQYPRTAGPPPRAGVGARYHAPNRYGGAPESSAQGGARRYAPSYRPQHDRSTLAPRRRSSPPPTHFLRQSYPPPRWNAWERQEWRPKSPRENEKDQEHRRERTRSPRAPLNRGHEYRMPPP
jgi:hypothetical protein